MNPTVLITGASSGIGAALAYVFAAKGYNTVLVARREDKLKAIAEDIEHRFETKAWVKPQDLSVANAAQTLYEQLIEKDIHINVLINNAGLGNIGKLAEQTTANSFQMLQVNVTALTELTQVFVKDMLVQKERDLANGVAAHYKIMNIASLAAFQPGPNMAVYFASKAYVLSFSEAIAEELKEANIGVTTVCPGITRTDFLEKAHLAKENLYTEWVSQSAQEVAEEAYKALFDGKRVHITGGVVNSISAKAASIVPNRYLNPITGWLIENIGGGKDVW
ncbi:SDR family NAD(P)-dependent oxidoreductase [Microscilla marina]|uniref:Short-chain dehydrogenase/reductase SDR n=1 Tax=Microscilla marina ATCC 23134 TaxID=313606 RepID=A1ZGN7_MICM2|nr:SDR family oxidoreductase [Microscilla marina]EAY30654.1 short-chain dehydrogenase/reductase SDR [Microscilla marina ATCC 23134]